MKRGLLLLSLVWVSLTGIAEEKRGLFLFHVNVHGKHQSSEPLVFDTDTGGQNIYVNDLVRALGAHPEVERVVVATRVLRGREWNQAPLSRVHARTVEPVPGTSNVWNVRFSIAGDRYLHKEDLWPHLDELAEQLITYLKQQPRLPDAIHAHYADAGYVGLKISRALGVPFLFTAHSLGLLKKNALTQSLAPEGGGEELAALEKTYHFASRRLPAELAAGLGAHLVITNSAAEVETQWRHYTPFHAPIEAIPPGVDTKKFFPASEATAADDAAPFTQAMKALADPKRPPVLAIARAAKTKNLPGLIAAFARNDYTRNHANLIIATNCDETVRKEMEAQAAALGIADRLLILTGISDKNAQLYRLVGRLKGVFANPAFYEAFGLTLLEAAASGVPVVGTRNGGPAEIIEKLSNGRTVDPFDSAAIGNAIEAILRNSNLWDTYSKNGVANFEAKFSWKAHAEKYVGLVKGMRPGARPSPEPSKRLYYRYRIEGGTESRASLAAYYRDKLRGKDVALIVTSSLDLERTHERLRDLNLTERVDVLVTDDGKRVFFGEERIEVPAITEGVKSSDELLTRFSESHGVKIATQLGRGIVPVVKSIQELAGEIEKGDVLVLDFDEVVVRSVDYIGREEAEPVLRARFEAEIGGEKVAREKLAYEKWAHLNLTARHQVRVEAVETALIDLANRHRAAGGRVLVLTSRDERWALLTRRQAARVGFTLEAGDVHYAGTRSKGEVLRELVASELAAGTKVHFLDDRANHLLGALSALESTPIDLRLYHYRVGEPHRSEFETDAMIEQMREFTRSGVVISNAEAKRRLVPGTCGEALGRIAESGGLSN